MCDMISPFLRLTPQAYKNKGLNIRTLNKWMSKINQTNVKSKSPLSCLTPEQDKRLKQIIEKLNATSISFSFSHRFILFLEQEVHLHEVIVHAKSMLVGEERNVLKEFGGKFVFTESWYDIFYSPSLIN